MTTLTAKILAIIETRSKTEVELPVPLREESAKVSAMILLAGLNYGNQIVIPSREEWIGVNLLERDDQLTRR